MEFKNKDVVENIASKGVTNFARELSAIHPNLTLKSLIGKVSTVNRWYQKLNKNKRHNPERLNTFMEDIFDPSVKKEQKETTREPIKVENSDEERGVAAANLDLVKELSAKEKVIVQLEIAKDKLQKSLKESKRQCASLEKWLGVRMKKHRDQRKRDLSALSYYKNQNQRYFSQIETLRQANSENKELKKKNLALTEENTKLKDLVSELTCQLEEFKPPMPPVKDPEEKILNS